ncbi:MAG: hypothetical protein RLZ98_367 [Pseudomonadota bacterium]|jgi:hypothetical protein
MQIETDGNVTRLIQKPWFAWLVCGGIVVASGVGYLWLAAVLPTRPALVQGIMQPVMWAALASVGAGILGLLISRTTTYTFDRATKTLTRTSKAVIGGRTDLIPYDKILAATLVEVEGSNITMPLAYHVVLNLSSGDRHYVADRSDRGYDPVTANAMIAAIKAALRGSAGPQRMMPRRRAA